MLVDIFLGGLAVADLAEEKVAVVLAADFPVKAVLPALVKIFAGTLGY